jgi:single-stranded DNA-binding protein
MKLGRDPEVKYPQLGTAIVQFSVATTERWRTRAANCNNARRGLF